MTEARRGQLQADQYSDSTKLTVRLETHERFGTNPVAWSDWVLGRLPIGRRASVLEVGGGPACLWRGNLDQVPAEWAVVMTDVSIGMVRDARMALGRNSPRVSLATCDAALLPFASGTFDVIVANHMLYHVEDVDATVAELRRVLRPRGTLLASTVGRNHMKELFAVARTASPAAAAAPAPRVAAFSLENGTGVLGRHFAAVRLHRYANDLKVTSAEPLMDYLLSTMSGQELSPEERRACSRRFERQVAAEGCFHITGDTGLYVATT